METSSLPLHYWVIALVALLNLIGILYLLSLDGREEELTVINPQLHQYPSEAEVALRIENNSGDTLRVAGAYVEAHADGKRVDLSKCIVYDLPPNEDKPCTTAVETATSYRIAGLEGFRRNDLSMRRVDIPLH